MQLQVNRSIIFLITMLSTKLLAAPFFCGSNGGVYSDQTFCNTACGATCQSIQLATSGSSGNCDTTKYDGFVFSGGKTFAISKTAGFWSAYSGLAQPVNDAENSIVKGIASYFGGSGWIGVYDPSMSTSFSTVDPSVFVYADGTSLTFSNWASGQPDNKNDNADIGTVAINGEHWAYIQSSGSWFDDGYHVSYGGDFKPKRKGIVEWSGPLSCVNGINTDQTSGSSGLWCSDSTGNLAQCQATTIYTSKTGSITTYPATRVNNLTWDNCDNGVVWGYTIALQMCHDAGMRFAELYETTAMDGPVPSCSGKQTYTQTLTPDGSGHYTWYQDTIGTVKYSNDRAVRCVKGTYNLGCPNGGTLSGSTCTVNTLACPTGYTATTGAETSKGECKKTGTPACPIGNYQCTDITGGVQNTDTAQGSTDKKANGSSDAAGNCLGNIYIFNGNDNRCRVPGIQTGFSDCCQKGDKWLGLAKCSPKEQSLSKLRDWGDLDGQCHYVGQYCSEKWPFIGCVQKKKTYCCFGSVLSRIIQEGGREQLGISWGNPESPQCRGFTPTEFQKIDFSKIDFSEWIKYDIIPNVQNNAVGNIKNTVNNISNSFQ